MSRQAIFLKEMMMNKLNNNLVEISETEFILIKESLELNISVPPLSRRA